ncbi:hypothetical protein P154DRAFT_210480 [Amniculicola lignicola CBS 123094]|uniref:Uncharacterized protein n=1 Tax=Amniculicola lignicola CBS 123094 TaxID=1392246 RepID=A0A6A5WGF7_9PLEO|nr:hypothetical protein P154DRAFT_210480 [Amniculicola lignicola CBS 123094]
MEQLHRFPHLKLILQIILAVFLARVAYHYSPANSNPPRTPDRWNSRTMEEKVWLRRFRERAIEQLKPIPRPEGYTHLEEIADLLDQIYTTLAKMTYIPHTAIERGPHILPATVTEKYNLDPMVVKLMEIIPYVVKAELESSRFLSGGLFADFRKEEDVSASREPFYCNWAFDEDNLKWRMNGHECKYMLPWVTPLTLMSFQGNSHILLYNARYNRLYFANMNHWSKDVVLEGEGLGVWWDETEELLDLQEDTTGFLGVPKHDAPALLKMHLQLLTSLKEFPWENTYGKDGEEMYEALTWMYRDNGWPDKFDENQFQADFIRWRVKLSNKGDPKFLYKEILREEGEDRILAQIGGVWEEELPRIRREVLEGNGVPFPRWTPIGRLQTLIREAEARLLAATDVDEIWRDKWSLHQNKRLLKEAEAHLNEFHEEYEGVCVEQRRLHGDCRVGPERILREFQAIERDLEGIERRTKEEREQLATRSFPVAMLELQTNWLAQRERELKWYTMAYEQSKAAMVKYCERTGANRLPEDNERNRAIEWNKDMRQKIAEQKEDLLEMRLWLSGVPAEAPETRCVVDTAIKEVESGIQSMEDRIRRTEEWYTEQGDPL